MNDKIQLKSVLAETSGQPIQRLTLFALLGLGILESLDNGVVSATDALTIFFNAENCLFVRQHLRDRIAEEMMSRGTQLSDLFDILPPAQAQHQFQREMMTMRALCLTLLGERKLAA